METIISNSANLDMTLVVVFGYSVVAACAIASIPKLIKWAGF